MDILENLRVENEKLHIQLSKVQQQLDESQYVFKQVIDFFI